MRFQLDEEYELTRAVVRDYADGELAGGALERDEQEQFDRSLFDSMAAMGLTGIPVSEKWGGAGSDLLAYAIVLEEISRVCASAASVLRAHTTAAWTMGQYGSLLEEKLTPLTTGARLGAFTFTGQDLRRKRVIHGSYKLSGKISSVDQAGAADDYILLVKQANGRVSLSVVPKEISGLSIGAKLNKLGLRSFPTAELYFHSCHSQFFNAVNKESETLSIRANGSLIVNAVNDMQGIAFAAQATGIAQGALDRSIAYAKERTQFGRPIGRQQGVAFKLADMAANVEASRWLVYDAAWAMDKGLPCSGKAMMAKRFALKQAVATAIEAVQIFGGYGYMKEYHVERYLRDAKCLEASSDDELEYAAILSSLETE
ncbi:acyl-CoA dehydrogenase family protein [Paenibacillus sp. YAF4_2]|uniref:acyl-CoA dehydrogenase family protein n=1 Tax=Paenibacillus sp. YAF4_2 TaxID=3233085 RepID=UPI003F9E4150